MRASFYAQSMEVAGRVKVVWKRLLDGSKSGVTSIRWAGPDMDFLLSHDFLTTF